MSTPDYLEDYDRLCRRIEEEPLPQSVGALCEWAARSFGDRRALVFFEDDEALSYAELDRYANRLAASLLRMGAGKRTHVGVMLPNIPALPIAWIALAKLGAVMVPINIGYTARELAYVLADADVEFLVLDETCLEVLDALEEGSPAPADERTIVVGEPGRPGRRRWQELCAGGDDAFTPPEPVTGDDLLNIQYTSGTTGFPKGCMLPHRYWLILGKIAGMVDDPPIERILIAQPFFYMDPQWLLLMAAYRGGTAYVARRASASRFMQWIRDHRIQYCLFPEVVCKEPASDLDREHELRRVSTFGLRPDLHRALEERFGVVAREAYGMTEVGCALLMPVEAEDMVGSGSCGRPAPFRKCMVADDEGRPVPAGRTGELWVAGDGILRGYYNKPEANARAFSGEWFKTGDLFRRDDRGFYYIVGRVKDMIRRSGENISAAEVEAVLRAMPEIAEAAVVAVPDDRRKEEVKAYVVLRPGIERTSLPPERIIAFCGERLARFKVPRYIEYRDSLPKTPSDKVAKEKLVAEKSDLRLGSFDRVDGTWR